MCALASLSLEKTLATVMRRRVPEHVFQLCAAQDRGFLENIVHLAQQVVPELNITLADAHKHGDVYVVRLPASTTEISVHLSQLREIEAYSPFRILEVGVKFAADGASVVIRVATENRPIAFSEVDIVRISKRGRQC